jgi:L-asparaginase
MTTRFILTGGTIDKRYNMFTGDIDFEGTHIQDMLKRARFTGEHIAQVLFLKDSLDITPEERQEINDACEDSEEDRIVITHGTDTMVETAEILSRNQKLAQKTIVMTGAMIPFALGEGEDAQFNLGAAIAYAEVLPAGVYVAMNGQAFEAENVRKDREAGVFKPIQ